MGIWVGRYAIVAGDVREHGPWLVERTLKRDDENVRLLVLADPVDARSAEFAAEVAEAVAELFTHESLSITGGLLRALRQAHANLAEWNRRSLREHRVAVGLTCIAVRGLEATIAQVGAGVVYIAGPEGVRRLATDEVPAVQPIGGDEPIEPQFFATPLVDSTLLMLTGDVDQLVGSGAIAEAIQAGPERMLGALYARTRGVDDMTAVVVADVEEYEEGAEYDEEPPAAVVGGDDFDLDPYDEDLEAAASEDDRRVASILHDQPQDEPEPRPRPILAAVPREPEAPTPVDSGPSEDHTPAMTGRMPSLRRQTSTYRPTAGAGGGGAASGGGFPRFRVPSSSLPGTAAWSSNRVRAYGLIAALAIAAILLGVCTLPGMLKEDRGAKLDDSIVAAQEHIAKAASATDPSVTRTELDAAAAEITRGRSISQDDSRLAGLQTQVDSGLAALNAVVDLGTSGLQRVLAFDGSITAPLTPAALVFGGDSLWLLDSQRGRIFRVGPGDKPDPIEVYRTDASYAGVVAKTPAGLAWDGVGGRLLILDGERHLFAIVPGADPVPLTVRGIGDLRSANAIASYDGNLYVLDPIGGEIWRYLPGGDGFDSERTNTLGGADIGEARALVVDGEFYLLTAAGVRHFRGDRELPALLKGIDKPLSSPGGIAEDTTKKLTYVADRGGRRVVVSTAEGNYLKQYRHPQFFDLRGIALDPTGTTAFALTGDGIYSFSPAP